MVSFILEKVVIYEQYCKQQRQIGD
jgi:hypothetical protein